jgi:hypothetical protein
MKTKLNFTQIIKAGLLAAITAAIINALLFFIFQAVGVFTDDIEIQPGQALSMLPVLISSIMPSIVGALVFFLIEKFSQNGYKIFGIVSIVLLILSFLNPFFNDTKCDRYVWNNFKHNACGCSWCAALFYKESL